MAVLLWIVRVYKWWLIAYVLLSWIAPVAESPFYAMLGIPVEPVIAPFRFLSFGGVSVAPIIPLLILHYAENWLAEKAGVVPLDGYVEPQQETDFPAGPDDEEEVEREWSRQHTP